MLPTDDLSGAGVPPPFERLGLTFDDVLLQPAESDVIPSEVTTESRVSKRVSVRVPLVSSPMDTVTEARMAVAIARQGGLGIIHRNLSIEDQTHQVDVVKRSEAGMIDQPITIAPEATIGEADAMCARYHISGVPVVDRDMKLLGIVTNRDMRFEHDPSRLVGAVMTPMPLITGHAGISSSDAMGLLAQNKIEKLPLVDDQGRLQGLITLKDFVKRDKFPLSTKDASGRLMVGAAIGATGDYLERAAELIRAGVDVLVIDIAHGHSIVMERAMSEFRKRFGDFEMIAGNVATADGARFLIERQADGIKVGIGPGGGCTTRMNTSFGVPQAQALVDCRLAVADTGIPIIADGGIKRHGALAESLLFGGDCAMLGSAFAGTEEAPGEIVHKSVVLPESQKTVKVPFKVLRGMASIEAIRDRLDVEDADRVELDALGAEGMEISVPARGSARAVVRDMIKHLCSSISYGGANSLAELRTLFWNEPNRYLIKVSASGRRESYER